jgi:hypothetical protein
MNSPACTVTVDDQGLPQFQQGQVRGRSRCGRTCRWCWTRCTWH